jgi:hypothetical protein
MDLGEWTSLRPRVFAVKKCIGLGRADAGFGAGLMYDREDAKKQSGLNLMNAKMRRR